MHRYLSLPQILPLAAPSAQMTRLLSVEELTSSVIRRQNAEEARLQLLKVDPPIESSRRATTSPSKRQTLILIFNFHAIFCFCFLMIIILLYLLCFIYRQKRREEKSARARKTEVTFRPNESIIPTQEVQQL